MLYTLFLFLFFLLFFVATIGFIINYYQHLSNKRKQHSISEYEKFIQGLISIPLKPALEGILNKDTKIKKRIITSSVFFSAILTTFFGGFNIIIFIFVGIILFFLWLSDG